ncbi:carbon-nitrogen hydrolase, partial [Aureobasidium melanogenum]
MALPKLKAAACHLTPHLLSAERTTQKTISFIQTAASQSAKLVVFPEASIPGFPVWSSILPPTKTHHFFRRLASQSLYVDGEEVAAIREAASKHRVTVSLGISEKVRYSSATLFNTNLIIGEDGQILVHHRKLMPTFFEKLSWAPGDGYGLRVADTPYGKIGALICGENTNPLARYSLMSQGEQVHISTWPAIWPTRAISEDTPGAETSRNYDNVTANHTRAAAHCFEAKCFGVMCAANLDDAAMDEIASMTEKPEEVRSMLKRYPRAASQFLDPNGKTVSGYVIDPDTRTMSTRHMLKDEEGILYATLDLNECIEGKQYHDVVGGYQRLDVFSLHVNRTRQEPATFSDGDDVQKDHSKE